MPKALTIITNGKAEYDCPHCGKTHTVTGRPTVTGCETKRENTQLIWPTQRQPPQE